MPTPAPAAARSRCSFSRSLLFLLAVPHPLTPSPRRGEGERGRGTRCRLRGQVRGRAPSFWTPASHWYDVCASPTVFTERFSSPSVCSSLRLLSRSTPDAPDPAPDLPPPPTRCTT